MLLRIIAYVASITTTWHLVEYVFTRNQMAGIYPPEADSISIPIITNQALLLALVVLILPTAMLGSAWVMKKLSSFRTILQIMVLIPCAGIYGISILICLSMALSSADSAHIEIGMSYAVILVLITAALIFDVIGLYRRLYKKQIPQ
jgi:hypothetical protein